jgi:DNA replication protein DnaC
MIEFDIKDKMRGILPMLDIEVEELKILKKELQKDYPKDWEEKFYLYALYLRSNLPRVYWDLDMKDFKGDKDLLKLVKKYIDNLEEALKWGQGFIFYGDYGTGKTSLACMIGKEAIKKDFSVKFISMSKILDMIKDSFDSYETKDRLDTTIERVEILILDDLGKEYFGVRKQLAPMLSLKLDSLFRERINRNRITVVTTNLGSKAIKETYGDSVWSVLNGACKPYEVKGFDFRAIKGGKFWKDIGEKI